MKFLSVCSGIEAASVAWGPLGWKAWAFSEIEAFPRAVLAHHYPDTPNLGDMTAFKDWPDATLDVLCGGTPCQSFSNAGLRAGLDDPRGQLMLTFGAIAARYRPRWLVWENVPGVLSSGGGRDFGAFLGLLGFLGYGFAYRVLDAQFVRVDGHGRAVPQRRNRVFVVGCLGDWRSAAAVLLERESLRGDPAPRREAGARVAATLTRGAESSGKGGYAGRRQEDDYNIVAGCLDAASQPIAFDPTQITSRENRSNPQPGDACHTLAKGAHAPVIAFQGRGSNIEFGRGVAATLTQNMDRASGGAPCIAFAWQAGGGETSSGAFSVEHSPTLPKNQTMAVHHAARVRRLMPVECERLMGFPDGYTAITFRGKPAADGPRYKALGNSWATNCVRWIGRRIAMVDAIERKAAA